MPRSERSFRPSTEAAIGTPLVRAFMRSLIRELPKERPVTLKEIAEIVLRKAKIEPEYVRATEDPAGFKQMRERLNREPGVMIANHPGASDGFVLINMLEREDVLVLVNMQELVGLKEYDMFVAAHAGKDPVLQKTKNPQELREQLKKIEAHIRGGGLFVIFPSGGSHDEFKDGIRVIFEHILQPHDMVYACHINPEDTESAELQIPGLMSEGLVAKGVSINLFRSHKRVRIDERYTQAGEWQEAIRDIPDRKARNSVLTQHFTSLWEPKQPAAEVEQAA